MVPRLQDVLAQIRRDVFANPERSRDHCLTNVEIERTGLWWRMQVNDQQGECYAKIVSIGFVIQKNEHDRRRTKRNASYSERSTKQKKMNGLFNTIVCIEQSLTPYNDTIISAF